MRKYYFILRDDLRDWFYALYYYIERKLSRFGMKFEARKDIVVHMLMVKRGTYQRPFLLFSLSVLFLAGVVSAPILADSYPGSVTQTLESYTPPSAVLSSFDLSEYGVQTRISEKPRDQIMEYTVVSGDTLESIAEKFGVSVDTLKWENNIKGDRLSISDTLKVPPVTGIVHKVKHGETIYTIAKKYQTDAQKIVNFPFNDFEDLDTFALQVGQTLMVPDGVMPEAKPVYARIPSITAGGAGRYLWPAGGSISQYPVWYHMAVDIANKDAPGIASADSGTVVYVQYLRYAYGNHVIIDHGSGMSTLYAHLSEIYIAPGDRVGRGQIIGRMGSTGRSTGIHLHFEIRIDGRPVNPLSYLK